MTIQRRIDSGQMPANSDAYQTPRIRQLAVQHLALDLQPDHREEYRHQAVVEPMKHTETADLQVQRAEIEPDSGELATIIAAAAAISGVPPAAPVAIKARIREMGGSYGSVRSSTGPHASATASKILGGRRQLHRSNGSDTNGTMTIVANPAISQEDYESLAAFRYELRQFLQFSEEAAKALGLTPQQHQALLAIRAAAGQTMGVGELGEQLFIQPHSASELADRLVALDLLSRRSAEQDRRRTVLALSDERPTASIAGRSRRTLSTRIWAQLLQDRVIHPAASEIRLSAAA